ncbi:hypothetical protein [Flaviaesturariibacter amylovorans]|uniref:DUF3108 domain-containing protein n=1 Tax=Flaviaesturariibacter amylovorans TaxID=1084520 RepID=A0ABP8G9J4_9BACT
MAKSLFLLSSLALGLLAAVPGPPGRIRIGQYTYAVKKSKGYLKDEWYRCSYLTFHGKRDELQAGILMEARRNDSIFVTGVYEARKDRLLLRNYYHYPHQHEPDSSVRVFVQEAGGRLRLRLFTEFRDGVARQVPVASR